MSESFGAMLRRLRVGTIATMERRNYNWSAPRRIVGPLTQNELARRSCIDPAYVNRLERAPADSKAMPSRAVTLRLADALELSQVETDELLIAAGLVPTTIAHMDDERRRALLVVLAG